MSLEENIFIINVNEIVIELTSIPLEMHVLTISSLLPEHALWSELQLENYEERK